MVTLSDVLEHLDVEAVRWEPHTLDKTPLPLTYLPPPSKLLAAQMRRSSFFNKCLSSNYYVPGTLLGPRLLRMNV